MAEPLIEFHDVTFAYRTSPEPVLRDINITVHRGEFVGIVAPVGSGKTTLLYLMAGVIPHYTRGILEGEVSIFGQDTRTSSLPEIARHVGLVMQDPETQLFNLIVRDEIVWGLENRGYPRDEMRALLDETLQFFNIESLRDRITYDLSGGEKQRVALSAVYVIRPEVLLLDHPTSQLDPVGASVVIESVRKLIDNKDVTVIMVEDKIDEMLEHADRLILLDKGEIRLDCPPHEFCTHTEELKRSGIRLPQVTELSMQLMEMGIAIPFLPLDVDEAESAFRQLLSNVNGRDHKTSSQQ